MIDHNGYAIVIVECQLSNPLDSRYKMKWWRIEGWNLQSCMVDLLPFVHFLPVFPLASPQSYPPSTHLSPPPPLTPSPSCQ